MTNDEALELWYAALHSPLGKVIQTDDPVLLRNKLYNVKRTADDPSLEGLSIVISPSTPGQLWIISKEKAQEAYRAANS